MYMHMNAWQMYLFFFIANGQYLLSGGMCGGGFVTRVHPAYNLQECEFNCDKDGRHYGRVNSARSFAYGSFIRGRGDCICSTQCSCLDSRRHSYEVSLALGSSAHLLTCESGTIQGMHTDSCHYFTDVTWTHTMWVSYECNPHTGGVTQVFYNYQTHCRKKQHIQRSYDFSMHTCFEHFPGERIKVTYCVGDQLRFSYCGEPSKAPTVSPTVHTTLPKRVTYLPPPTTLHPTSSTTHRRKSTTRRVKPTTITTTTEFPSKSPSLNMTVPVIVGERGRTNIGNVIGLTIYWPYMMILFLLMALFGVCWCTYSKQKKQKERKRTIEHVLLEDSIVEEQREEWFERIHDRNHWKSAIRAYPGTPSSMDVQTDILRDASHYSATNEASARDRHWISTLPITPQQQRDFWKRDPSMSETQSYLDDPSPRGYGKFHQARKKYTEDVSYSSEQMTSDSTNTGRSTHPSASSGRQAPPGPTIGGVGFTKRFSLRAVDDRDNAYNELKGVVVMRTQLANYLKERKLDKFIPDLESFGVSRTSDLMELHRSDINSFEIQPTRQERQKLENLFLLGAIE